MSTVTKCSTQMKQSFAGLLHLNSLFQYMKYPDKIDILHSLFSPPHTREYKPLNALSKASFENLSVIQVYRKVLEGKKHLDTVNGGTQLALNWVAWMIMLRQKMEEGSTDLGTINPVNHAPPALLLNGLKIKRK